MENAPEESAGRFDALQTTDEPVNMLINWHVLNPTQNEEPTEESPNVVKAARIITNEWLKDKPNVTLDWFYGFEMTDEYMSIQYSAGTGPDTASIFNAVEYDKEGWIIHLDEALNSPNYYEPGSPKWLDMFPEYIWDKSGIEIRNMAGDIIALPQCLNPGPATAYYYNKNIFAELGLTPSSDWDEMKEVMLACKEAGYTADVPYAGCLIPTFANWDAQFSLTSYFDGFLQDLDFNGNGKVDNAELYRAQYEDGFFYLENNPGMVEFYDEICWKYWNALDEGVASIDYTQPWRDGTVAMREDGLWAMSGFMSDTAIPFEIGMFPMPVKTQSDYINTSVEFTESGPYQPTAMTHMYFFEPSIQGRPEYLKDYLIDWCKYMFTTENMSMQVEENGTCLGPLKGCRVPGTLTEWMSNSFPILPSGTGYLNPSMFKTVAPSAQALIEQYAYNMISKDEWIRQHDELMYNGLVAYLENAGDELKTIEKDYGWGADDWSDPVKPSWM